MEKHIILFDGVCNFCNWNVQFIMKHDPHHKFLFASLQSDVGLQLLNEYKVSSKEDSLILINYHRYYTQSTAALKIARHLNGIFPLLYIFILIPRPIRNFLYRIIANNRYKWFGKRTNCKVPTPQEKKRFLS